MEPDSNFQWSEITTFSEPLTLRDRFAIEAMKQMNWSGDIVDQCAEACFVVADAMLAARDAK